MSEGASEQMEWTVDAGPEAHASPSVYVAFRHVPPRPEEAVAPLHRALELPSLEGRAVDFLVWTARPGGLAENRAIAVHPECQYVFYAWGARVVCVAHERLRQVLAEVAAEELTVKRVKLGQGEARREWEAASLVDATRIVGYVRGEELKGYRYRHPVYTPEGEVVLGSQVTLDVGTGLVPLASEEVISRSS